MAKFIYNEEKRDLNTGVFNRTDFRIVEEEEIIPLLEASGILLDKTLSVKEDKANPEYSTAYMTFGKGYVLERKIVITSLADKSEEEVARLQAIIENSKV